MFEREENPCNVTNADIVVGIPSYNEADSIAYPTQQASIGLKKYFPDKTSVIINSDNHSPDNTEKVFLNTDTEVPKIFITTPPNTPGKGRNLENMFHKSLELGAKAFICVDADLRSITPEWIKYFGDPIFNGFDFATPVYSRHKYDGTITNNICFPLIHGLFCQDIRQPIGGDFALSPSLISHLIRQPWHSSTHEYGIDIFMSMNAIAGKFKICKTGLGKKQHKPSAPKLGPMFIQVVNTAFRIITKNFQQWKNHKEIKHTPQFGLKEPIQPQALKINRESIKKNALKGFRKHKNLLKEVISPDTFSDLHKMYSKGSFDINNEQWATIIYDTIDAFMRTHDKLPVIEALMGLYFGRTLSFVNKTWEWSTARAENEILKQADCFYKKRDYLIDKLNA